MADHDFLRGRRSHLGTKPGSRFTGTITVFLVTVPAARVANSRAPVVQPVSMSRRFAKFPIFRCFEFLKCQVWVFVVPVFRFKMVCVVGGNMCRAIIVCSRVVEECAYWLWWSTSCTIICQKMDIFQKSATKKEIYLMVVSIFLFLITRLACVY